MYGAKIKETSTTSGTGNLTLLGAVTGFRTFNTVFGTGGTNVFAYIADDLAGNWEIGRGHLSASSTLVRDTLEQSSTGSFISFSGATLTVFCAWERGVLIDRITATGSNTWTKRPGAKTITPFLVAPGGPSGSGRKGTSATVKMGGSAGGGGGVSMTVLDASIVGTTETVIVGDGGTGGAAVSASSTNGNPGVAGANNFTSFGNWLKATGGAIGLGGTAVAVAGGAGGVGNMGNGGAGGGTTVTTGVGVAGSQGTGLGAGGGGGGGGTPTANTAAAAGAGAAGAPCHGSALTGGAAGSGATAPTAGTAATTGEAIGGPGSGGGACTSATSSQAGAVPTNYGGGAGGGSCGQDSVYNSGAGQAGGPGIAVIFTGL